MYLVYYNAGSWDDFYTVDIFVTEYEYKAKEYCSKFNDLLAKIKPRYQQAWDSFDETGSTPEWFGYKGHKVIETNGAYYRKIELR